MGLLFSFLGLTLAPTGANAKQIDFEGVQFQVFTFDPKQKQLQLFWRDESQQPLQTFRKLDAHLRARRQQLWFAINAGIYEPGWIPSGLHIENGKTLVPLNRNPPPPRQPGQFTPNFYLKPNGVFFLDEQGPGILETEAYAQAGRKPKLAVQSGPLLLFRGKIHPIFERNSQSRLLRNGVGVTSKGNITFASSVRSAAGQTNFHQFARLFLHLDCREALYLGGDISEFYLRPENPEIQTTTAFAAMFAIAEELP